MLWHSRFGTLRRTGCCRPLLAISYIPKVGLGTWGENHQSLSRRDRPHPFLVPFLLEPGGYLMPRPSKKYHHLHIAIHTEGSLILHHFSLIFPVTQSAHILSPTFSSRSTSSLFIVLFVLSTCHFLVQPSLSNRTFEATERHHRIIVDALSNTEAGTSLCYFPKVNHCGCRQPPRSTPRSVGTKYPSRATVRRSSRHHSGRCG